MKCFDGSTDTRCVTRRLLMGGALATTAMAMSSSLAGCKKNASSSTQDGAKDKNTLSLGVVGPLTLDPIAAVDAGSRQVVGQLFDPLFRYDAAHGELEPVAARAFEFSDDARTLTVFLREMTFHDGTPVTAEDYRRSWERLCAPAGAVAERYGNRRPAYLLSLVSGYDEFVSGGAKNLAGVHCPDNSTLVIELTVPYADFPSVLSHPALAAVPSSADKDGDAFVRNPVGSGPYALARARLQQTSSVELTRYEGEPAYSPAIDAFRIKVFKSESELYSEFLTEELDGCTPPTSELRDIDYDVAQAPGGQQIGEGVKLAFGARPTVYYLACNTALPLMGNADVRRAFSQCIDRERVCDTMFHGAYVPAFGLIPPSIHGAGDFAWPYTALDVNAARKLLEGIADTESEHSLLFAANSGLKKVAEELANQLGHSGVSFKAKSVKKEELERALKEGSFEIVLLAWTADAPTPDCVLYPLLHSAAGGATNKTGYRNAQVDAKINEARAELDGSRRMDCYAEASALAAQDAPVIPLFFSTYAYAVHSRIENMYVSSDGVPVLAMTTAH